MTQSAGSDADGQSRCGERNSQHIQHSQDGPSRHAVAHGAALAGAVVNGVAKTDGQLAVTDADVWHGPLTTLGVLSSVCSSSQAAIAASKVDEVKASTAGHTPFKHKAKRKHSPSRRPVDDRGPYTTPSTLPLDADSQLWPRSPFGSQLQLSSSGCTDDDANDSSRTDDDANDSRSRDISKDLLECVHVKPAPPPYLMQPP